MTPRVPRQYSHWARGTSASSPLSIPAVGDGAGSHAKNRRTVGLPLRSPGSGAEEAAWRALEAYWPAWFGSPPKLAGATPPGVRRCILMLVPLRPLAEVQPCWSYLSTTASQD